MRMIRMGGDEGVLRTHEADVISDGPLKTLVFVDQIQEAL